MIDQLIFLIFIASLVTAAGLMLRYTIELIGELIERV